MSNQTDSKKFVVTISSSIEGYTEVSLSVFEVEKSLTLTQCVNLLIDETCDDETCDDEIKEQFGFYRMDINEDAIHYNNGVIYRRIYFIDNLTDLVS